MPLVPETLKKEFRDLAPISYKELGEATGIPASSLSVVMTGHAGMSEERIKQLETGLASIRAERAGGPSKEEVGPSNPPARAAGRPGGESPATEPHPLARGLGLVPVPSEGPPPGFQWSLAGRLQPLIEELLAAPGGSVLLRAALVCAGYVHE